MQSIFSTIYQELNQPEVLKWRSSHLVPAFDQQVIVLVRVKLELHWVHVQAKHWSKEPSKHCMWILMPSKVTDLARNFNAGLKHFYSISVVA
jgi:hypothetical protein